MYRFIKLFAIGFAIVFAALSMTGCGGVPETTECKLLYAWSDDVVEISVPGEATSASVTILPAQCEVEELVVKSFTFRVKPLNGANTESLDMRVVAGDRLLAAENVSGSQEVKILHFQDEAQQLEDSVVYRLNLDLSWRLAAEGGLYSISLESFESEVEEGYPKIPIYALGRGEGDDLRINLIMR